MVADVSAIPFFYSPDPSARTREGLMPIPDSVRCSKAAALDQSNVSKELGMLAAILIEKAKAENRFWERVLTEPERVG